MTKKTLIPKLLVGFSSLCFIYFFLDGVRSLISARGTADGPTVFVTAIVTGFALVIGIGLMLKIKWARYCGMTLALLSALVQITLIMPVLILIIQGSKRITSQHQAGAFFTMLFFALSISVFFALKNPTVKDFFSNSNSKTA